MILWSNFKHYVVRLPLQWFVCLYITQMSNNSNFITEFQKTSMNISITSFYILIPSIDINHLNHGILYY